MPAINSNAEVIAKDSVGIDPLSRTIKRLSFAVTPGEWQQAMLMGSEEWINWQLDYESIDSLPSRADHR